MFRLVPALRRRRLSLAIGTSALAWAIACPADANAQCAPDPTATNGTTTCAGSDTDGLTINTSGTRVVVASGATVVPGNAAAAITVRSTNAQITVNGLVDGSGKPGIAVIAGPAYTGPCDPYAGAAVGYCVPGSTQTYYPSAGAAITVAAGATVQGSQALRITRDPSNTLGMVSVDVVNAGTLTGTAGPAIFADNGNSLFYPRVTNLATGSIAGIVGAFSVDNAGLIDGGAIAAIVGSAPTGGLSVTNTGRILSSGPASTVSSASGLNLTNAAGATLGGSAIAISAAGALTLVNAGTINGSVVSTGRSTDQSMVDTRAGQINGSLILGAGNDTLRARFNAQTGQISSITGTIDGGAGTDTVMIGVDSDSTFGAVVLPTNFELLGVDLSNSATLTLATGFTSGTGIVLGGSGNVINQANLVTAGPAVTTNIATGALTFTNDGAITTTLANNFQLGVNGLTKLTNNGTITVAGGDGVRVASLVNSGTITASGIAASTTLSFANSGTIRSTGGTAASLSGNTATNDGTIIGAVTGVNLMFGTLANSGTISGGTSGVDLGYSAILTNNSGGTVTGNVRNVGSSVRVINAGTIDGAVNLAVNSPFDSSDDVFVDRGGTVRGAISLGGGADRLILDLVAPAGRALAGATGGVSGGDGFDTLHYRVNVDASVAPTLTNGFEGLAYELNNGAKLTLTAASPTTTTIGLTGNGTVTLDGTFAAADATLVDATARTEAQLTGGGQGPSQALSIVNNGTLNLSSAASFGYVNRFAVNAGTANFTNNGTIAVSSAAGSYYPAGAIFNGKAVTNTGAITLSGGGTAISNVQTLVNSGTITGARGSAVTGVASFTSLDNSGTIQVDGTAVQANYSTGRIANSGTIESRMGTAVLLNYASTLTNEAAGVVRGVTAVDVSAGGTLINRGAIVGNVQASGYAYSNVTYVADGGTITGNLTFGSGNDIFIAMGDDTGVSGTINGGAGQDTYIRSRNASGTITLGAVPLAGFELQGVQAVGADTVVTMQADAPFDAALYLSGNGSVVNTATINRQVQTLYPIGFPAAAEPYLASFANKGTILGGFEGTTRAFSNSGTIGGGNGTAVMIRGSATLDFDNSGTIDGAVALQGYEGGSITANNSGAITEGGFAAYIGTSWPAPSNPLASSISVTNSGSILNTGDALTLSNTNYQGIVGSVALNNSGTIESSGPAGWGAVLTAYRYGQAVGAPTIDVTNSGTIRANGGGVQGTYFLSPAPPLWTSVEVPYTSPAIALAATANPGSTVTVHNTATGTIEATGALSTAIGVSYAGLDLINDGTIRGGAGTLLDAEDVLAGDLGQSYLAGAIQAFGDGSDRIVNNGTIIGSIDLTLGDDRIENYGRIDGNVFLGLGDDTFLQRASAVLTGTVDAGDGIDSFIVDATGGGTINGDQFVNFERFSQIGDGTVTYAGSFRIDTIGVSGGSLSVAAGQTLSSAGATTITGSGNSETVTNYGTVAGSTDLGGGNDVFVNGGSVLGSVALGAGDDRFVDGVGSSVAASVDGGDGNDIYAVLLAGDRSGIQRRTGFERLAVDGSGTLALTLDQSFDSVSLSGTGLNLQLAGFTLGSVSGSDAAESVTVDGDIGNVALGGGNDQLVLGGSAATGLYLGQGGTDQLRFSSAGPVTLTGTATGFEQILLSGGTLTVAGVLGAAGDTIGFGDGGQQVVVANGGKLTGVVDLGAGDDGFRLAAGGIINGSVSGGAGRDTLTLDVTGGFTLAGNALRDFEVLATEGTGAFTIADAIAFERVSTAGNFTIAGSGALTTGQLVFGTGDDRMTIAGRFTGSVDGGTGSDLIAVSGGSVDAPIAFTNVANVESFAMSGGYATLSGAGTFGTMALTGGRFVGFAGSSIGATQINVGQGATFGSAGTVTGNLAVAGTLSPGASPGTMTVTGNVALAGTSVSLFELTPTVYDKLIVNGAVSIAPGATLQLVTSGTLRPGASYDLITASGGITGSYSTVLKPDSLFGFIVQNANSIRLLGQFLSGADFTLQVRNSIDYANATLAVQPANSSLFAAVPALLLNGSASNPQAFAQLTPEPYAAATQMGVDNALALANVARGPAFGAGRKEAGFFTFGQTLAQWRRFGADAQTGSSATTGRSYGFLGGVGFGSQTAMVGAFAGYLNDRQQIGALGARSQTDGFVAGVHGRWAAPGGLGIAASILYDGGDARTNRALPGASSAAGQYALHSWAGDLSVSYAVPVGKDWAVKPKLGLTYIRTIRDGATEAGGSSFALNVARDRHVAGFGDAALSFGRHDASQAPFRPFVSIGARYQLRGMRTDALAGYAGGSLGLTAFGPSRARLTGTAASGFAYSLDHGLDLFATASSQVGTDDHQETLSAGIRLQF